METHPSEDAYFPKFCILFYVRVHCLPKCQVCNRGAKEVTYWYSNSKEEGNPYWYTSENQQYKNVKQNNEHFINKLMTVDFKKQLETHSW